VSEVIIPAVGQRSMMRAVLSQAHTLRLFANDITPKRGDTAADYVEVEGGGYVPRAVRWPMWGIDEDLVAHLGEQRFVFDDAAGRVYGWYLTCDVDGAVLCAGRLRGGPQEILGRGDNLGFEIDFSLPPARIEE
jgi:hypothetical protein